MPKFLASIMRTPKFRDIRQVFPSLSCGGITNNWIRYGEGQSATKLLTPFGW